MNIPQITATVAQAVPVVISIIVAIANRKHIAKELGF